MTDTSFQAYNPDAKTLILHTAKAPFRSEALVDVSVGIERRNGLRVLSGTPARANRRFVQLFNGLIKPQSGTVMLDGRIFGPTRRKSASSVPRRGVFQVSRIPASEETVRRDIAFGPAH